MAKGGVGVETLSVDGKTIRIYSSGSGRPLVYLHSAFGEVGPIAVFKALEERGFAITAPELSGFGKSETITDWDSIEDVVYYLRRVLDEAGVGRAILVGSSIGGWLAAELAVWFPDRVAGLVLLDAAGLRLDEVPLMDLFMAPQDQAMAASNPRGVDLIAALQPGLEIEGDPEAAIMMHFLRAMDTVARIGYSPYLHDPKLQARLAQVKAPTLVLWGDQDGLIPLAYGEAYASGIEGAHLEVIADSGHLPALEQPLAVADAIARFSEKLPDTAEVGA
jgi:pimeloyl-ACP methyl ester carboxylesterase